MADDRLYYWPIPFRGNFVRSVLAYKGIDYTEATSPEIVKLKSTPVSEQPTPAMAPPIIQNLSDGEHVSQTGAIITDLNAFALWETMERCLPGFSPTLREHAPCVTALVPMRGSQPLSPRRQRPSGSATVAR